MKTLWQKSSDETPGRDFFHQFTTAEDRKWDQQLIPYDILVNIAQARMLHRVNIYNDSELSNVTNCLSDLYKKWDAGNFSLSEEDEDVHSATEKYLTEHTGEAGKRIHTGRSRNDQVVTDINLALKEELRICMGMITSIIRNLDRIAVDNEGVFFAGMTHTQPAMPTSADAWAAGYIRLLLNDLDSLKHAYRQVDFCPLGSAAGYGAPHIPIDREYLSSKLGFAFAMTEVNAVQLSRSASAMRVIHALEYAGLSLNRMAADIIEFLRSGFIHLDDSQISGSSIMPQKRNPDLWELIRGAYHRLTGAGRELSSISANLTSGYHRDLQPVKAVVLNALKQSQDLTQAADFGLSGMSFNKKECHTSITSEVMATHHANKLVNEGLPFREAYRQTASELETIPVPDNETLKATYAHTGAPGSYPKEEIHKDLAQIEQWLHQEEDKWKNTIEGLIE